MSRKKLYLDLDGVLYNWDLKANELLSDISGKSLTYPSPSWDSLEQEAGKEAWDKLWNEYYNLYALFSGGEPVGGALQAVHRLYTKYNISVITMRPRRAQQATIHWLAAYSIPFDSFHIIGPGQKKPDCVVEPPLFFVDDKPKNVEEAQKGWGLGDDQVFLFGAAHNKGMHLSRVEGWDPILERLL